MNLVQNGPFFQLFCGIIQARKMCFMIFYNEKTPFQAIKTRNSKSRKNDIFLNWLVHGFGYILLHGILRCYIVLHSVTLRYIVLHSVTCVACYTVLHCVTQCYMVLHSVTYSYMVLYGVTQWLYSVTWCYKVSHTVTDVTQCYTGVT